MKRKRKFSVSLCLKYASFAAAGIAALALVGITLYILISGLPHVTWNFLFGKYVTSTTMAKDEVSIFPAIVSTLILILLTLVVAIPLGVAAAVFLTEYTKPGSKFVKAIRLAVDTLTGIPSIVYGLFGALFFGYYLKLGSSILTGTLTMAIVVLPTIIRATEESIKTVPGMYREGSFALGAGKQKTVFKIVLPGALPGIITSVILSVGRLIGESAAILLTIGYSAKYVVGSLTAPTTNLAGMVYFLTTEFKNEAKAASAVLLILVILLNIGATLIGSRLQRKNKA
ncbi:phosphate transport system permease protein PstA [Clostridia bacterium]|nr:phosphate transport system permease protein PstA [Clostridia bacterium]